MYTSSGAAGQVPATRNPGFRSRHARSWQLKRARGSLPIVMLSIVLALAAGCPRNRQASHSGDASETTAASDTLEVPPVPGKRPGHTALDQRSSAFEPVSDMGLTAPINGPNSIASLERGELGGVPQWITLRGADASLPLLLWLHGGPGWTETPFRSFQQGLEEHFVVVHWDQRGAGKSYSPVVPRDSMTMAQLVADARSLVDMLLARFGRQKLFLLGHSWGAVLGLQLVHLYPDRFQAFVSVGQPVNNDLEDELSLEFVKSTALHRQDSEALAELSAVELPYPSRKAGAIHQRWLMRFGGMIWEKKELIDLIFNPHKLGETPEYTADDWRRRTEGAAFSMDCLRVEMRDLDLFAGIPAVDVPVYFFLGIHDHQVPFEASAAYFASLKAPRKEIVWFHESAHFPHLEEPDKFRRMVVVKLLGNE